MVKKLRGMWEGLYGAAVELIADNGFVLAASIAFFTIFSLAPLLLLVVAVTGLVFGEVHFRRDISQPFKSSLCRSGLDDDILTFDVSERAQALTEGFQP